MREGVGCLSSMVEMRGGSFPADQNNVTYESAFLLGVPMLVDEEAEAILMQRIDDDIVASEEKYLLRRLEADIAKAQERYLLSMRGQFGSRVDYVLSPNDDVPSEAWSELSTVDSEAAASSSQTDIVSDETSSSHVRDKAAIDIEDSRLCRGRLAIPKYLDPRDDQPLVEREAFQREVMQQVEKSLKSSNPICWLTLEVKLQDLGSDSYLVDAKGYEEALDVVRSVTAAWVRCKIDRYNVRRIISDNQSRHININVKCHHPLGVKFGSEVMSSFDRNVQENDGVWVSGVSDPNGSLASYLGPSTLRAGVVVKAIDGKVCRSYGDVVCHVQRAQYRRDRKSTMVVTVCVSKFADKSRTKCSRISTSDTTDRSHESQEGDSTEDRPGNMKESDKYLLSQRSTSGASTRPKVSRGQRECSTRGGSQRQTQQATHSQKLSDTTGQNLKKPPPRNDLIQDANPNMQKPPQQSGSIRGPKQNLRKPPPETDSVHGVNRNLKMQPLQNDLIHAAKKRKRGQDAEPEVQNNSRSTEVSCLKKPPTQSDLNSGAEKRKRVQNVALENRDDSRSVAIPRKEKYAKKTAGRPVSSDMRCPASNSDASETDATRPTNNGSRRSLPKLSTVQHRNDVAMGGSSQLVASRPFPVFNERCVYSNGSTKACMGKATRRLSNEIQAKAVATKTAAGIGLRLDRGPSRDGKNRTMRDPKLCEIKGTYCSLLRAMPYHRRENDKGTTSIKSILRPSKVVFRDPGRRVQLTGIEESNAMGSDNKTSELLDSLVHAAREGTCDDVIRILSGGATSHPLAYETLVREYQALKTTLNQFREYLDRDRTNPALKDKMCDLNCKYKVLKIYIECLDQIQKANALESWSTFEVRLRRIGLRMTEKPLNEGRSDILVTRLKTLEGDASMTIFQNEDQKGFREIVLYESIKPRKVSNNPQLVHEPRFLVVEIEQGIPTDLMLPKQLGSLSIPMNRIHMTCEDNGGAWCTIVEHWAVGCISSVEMAARRVHTPSQKLEKKREGVRKKLTRELEFIETFNRERDVYKTRKLNANILGPNNTSLLQVADKLKMPELRSRMLHPAFS